MNQVDRVPLHLVTLYKLDHDQCGPGDTPGFRKRAVAFSWGDRGGFLEEVRFKVGMEVKFELTEMEDRQAP